MTDALYMLEDGTAISARDMVDIATIISGPGQWQSETHLLYERDGVRAAVILGCTHYAKLMRLYEAGLRFGRRSPPLYYPNGRATDGY